MHGTWPPFCRLSARLDFDRLPPHNKPCDWSSDLLLSTTLCYWLIVVAAKTPLKIWINVARKYIKTNMEDSTRHSFWSQISWSTSYLTKLHSNVKIIITSLVTMAFSNSNITSLVLRSQTNGSKINVAQVCSILSQNISNNILFRSS